MMVGSMLPDRVPMRMPSCGVKPMEVSTARPRSTAVMEEPLPRWQVTIFSSDRGRPILSAALPETYRWEVPWKPYRRIRFSSYSR